MADDKKSVIQEVLAEFDLIGETLNSNAKEILRSIAKEEIKSTLNESLNEDDYDIEDIEDVDTDTDVDALPVDDAPEATPDFGGEEGGSEELGLDDIGMDSGEEDLEIGLGAEEGSEDYGIDMTDASDEEVITVYKKLSGDDEIEVVSSEEVIIKDPVSGAEYNVKINGGGSLIDQGEISTDDLGGEEEIGAEPEADFGGEEEIGAEPEVDFGGEEEIGAEPEAEFGGEEEEEEEEDIEDDDELGEAVVYEIELSEDEPIEEGLDNNLKINKDSKVGATADGKPRTATSDRTMGKEASAPNTGDIEGQKAPNDSDSGDNLEGGFTEKHNGSGGNHAAHVMEGEDDVNEETEEITESGNIEGQKAPVAKPAEEKTSAKGNAHADHVMEAEDDSIEETEDVTEEVVEEEDTIEEQIPKGHVQARTMAGRANIGQPVAPGAKQGVKFVRGESVEAKKLVEAVKKYNTLLGEARELKKENETFKSSLKDFRKTITETAVFNINLTHATKLFLEHSTTSDEKKNILSRFDEEVTTIEESKKLYKQINSELGQKDTVTESFENKMESKQTSGQAKQILESKKLNERVAYVDPAQQRVLDLIRRTK